MASGPFSNQGMADAGREAFRRYLEEKGVIEALTRALAKLCEQATPPDDALAFVAGQLGVTVPDRVSMDTLHNQLADAQAELARLRIQLNGHLPSSSDSSST